MKAQILRSLLQAYSKSDDQAFRRAALQLAATESAAGHHKIAEEIRRVVEEFPPSKGRQGQQIDIAQPRGELGHLLTGGFRDERLRDIVLSVRTRESMERMLQEHRARAAIESWGVRATRKLLFFGPPGCGKTLGAMVVAGELGLPILTVRLDGLFSRFLGATAGHLKTIFDEMPRRPAVYFFDEFDAVGKHRGDPHEVGEIRRVLTSFLQLMDADRSPSIIIAATNFDELLDRAVFRRFDAVMPFEMPEHEGIKLLLRLRLGMFRLDDLLLTHLAHQSVGLSFADVARACDHALRTMILEHRDSPTNQDLQDAVARERERVGLGNEA